MAERVREDIENAVFTYDGLDLKVTVSLGVTWWSGDDSIDSPEALVAAVDRRLYEAKDNGRNCISHDPLPGGEVPAEK